MPQFLYLLVDHPVLIVALVAFFAGFALWTRSRTAWVASAAWVLYLLYELGMHAGILCTGEDACMKRGPLYIGYPILAFISVIALVQGYVRIRGKRLRERQQAMGRLSVDE